MQAFGKAISVAALKSRLRHVERSFIRVEADELTYPAHVILRFRLEQAIGFRGIWRWRICRALGMRGCKRSLALRRRMTGSGCLQDIHWYDGAFGYFPSYTLGAMAAAQLMAAARRAVPGLDAGFAQGDIAPLTAWLSRNVHSQGARLGFGALLEQATGRGVQPGGVSGASNRALFDGRSDVLGQVQGSQLRASRLAFNTSRRRSSGVQARYRRTSASSSPCSEPASPDTR